MENLASKQEKFKFFNTLLCLAKSLENRVTTVDLRNETTVTGRITQVDGCMNVVLKDAALYDTDGDYHYLPLMYIHARNIRNIHIPENVKITKAIKEQVAPKQKMKKRRTFKESRAQKRQEETKKLVKEMLKEKEAESEKNDS